MKTGIPLATNLMIFGLKWVMALVECFHQRLNWVQLNTKQTKNANILGPLNILSLVGTCPSLKK